MTVMIVPTGIANIASVKSGLRRAGVAPQTARKPSDVATADHVVLPGVGSFGAAMSSLDAHGMRSVLTERVLSGRPTLAVCVGLQVLCSQSEESPNHTGLGVIAEKVRRFNGDVRVPQIGWNRVEPEPGGRFLKPGWAYFANSYRLASLPDGWTGTVTDYGGPFVAAMERGDLLACQFHPELSGQWGAEVLHRWLDQTGAIT